MSTPLRTDGNDQLMTLAPAAQHAISSERPAKRQRLSLACNECRKRKVKCDAQMPKCRNCRVRDIVCETTDPKHPELVVVRKYGLQYQDGNALEDPTSTPRSTVEREKEQRTPPSTERTAPSWLARSYQAHRALDPGIMIDTRQYASSLIHDHAAAQSPLPSSHESPDIAINTDTTRHHQKLMGGSSLQSLTMFLDLYLQRAGLPQIGPCFRHGMSFAEEYLPSLLLKLPDLPPASLMDIYVTAYVQNIHPLYPVLELDQLCNDVQRIRTLQDSGWSPSGNFAGLKHFIQAADIPTLVYIYGVISLGADEAAGTPTKVGDDFLSAAYGLYAHLVGQPHLPSAQALILIFLALRGRGRDGQSFHVLGTAIRICHSIGMHRRIPSARWVGETLQKKTELHGRIWWTCFALEKLMELESTRPSAIPHGEHDQFLPLKMLSTESRDRLRYFVHWVSLSIILERISDLLYRRKRGAESTFELLLSIGNIDRALRDWKNLLPEDIRPDDDFYCEDNERPFAIFLALQYHQALITLHRASLVLPHNQFLDEIEARAEDLPFHQRLRKGASLCVASACSIIKLNVGAPRGRLQTPLYTLTQTLHGCVVLALSILKQPQSRTVRSDVELLMAGAQLAESDYRKLGQHPKFVDACSILRSSVRAFIHREGHERFSSEPSSTHVIQQPTPSSIDGPDRFDSHSTIWESMMRPKMDSQNGIAIDYDHFLGELGLEDLWTIDTLPVSDYWEVNGIV